MLQPARAHVQQRQHEEREPAPTVIAARGRTGRAQSARQVALPQVPTEQLQAAVRRQSLLDELDVELSLDQPPQARYAQSHPQGLLCEGSNVGTFSLSIAQGAFLFQIYEAAHDLFSDWG